MIGCQVRTDLALEATESVQKSKGESVQGICLEEYDVLEDVHVTKVKISTKNAAKRVGKSIGTYITIESPTLSENDEEYHREISEVIAQQIRMIVPDIEHEKDILVVGLGNSDVTADALGPFTTDHLLITRHMLREYGKQAYHAKKMHRISSLVPGVMAKTGMETSEILLGVIKETNPDVVIVIDALAARNTKRLNRTVQITDTGIHPGSGVGNHRVALTKETLGVPTIAIGIPMVVDAGTIITDALIEMLGEGADMQDSLYMLKQNMNTNFANMYVTTKNIDEMARRLSYTLSEAINSALDMEYGSKEKETI